MRTGGDDQKSSKTGIDLFKVLYMNVTMLFTFGLHLGIIQGMVLFKTRDIIK